MSVAAAHLPSTTGHLALREAAQQAVQRQTTLTVIQITDAQEVILSADIPVLVVKAAVD